MTFRLVDETANANGRPPPPGVDFLPMQSQPGEKIAVRRRVEVDGANLTDARAGQNPQTGEWVVNFTFNSRRRPPLRRRHAAPMSTSRFAIVLDDKVISRPGHPRADHRRARPDQRQVHRDVGQRPVGAAARGRPAGAADGRGGAQRRARARARMRSAPAPSRSRSASCWSSPSWALFYGLFGWFANVALVVNLVLMMRRLSLLQATLTLPGMAGILLTLGMAVDANILINERIREEAERAARR